MLVIERFECVRMISVLIQAPRRKRKQRAKKRHVHRCQEQSGDTCGASFVNVAGSTECRSPEPHCGDQERALFGEKPCGRVTRPLMKHRGVPHPHNNKLEYRSWNCGEKIWRPADRI